MNGARDQPKQGDPARHAACIDRQTAVADQSESEDIHRRPADAVADDAHDPNQEPDDQHGQSELHERPGDGGPKAPPHIHLMLVVVGQLGQHGVEPAGLFAQGDHLAEQGGEKIAGRRQGVGQRFAAANGVGGGRKMLVEPACGPVGLAADDGANVDARLQRHAQAAAEPDQRFGGDAGRKEHSPQHTVFWPRSPAWAEEPQSRDFWDDGKTGHPERSEGSRWRIGTCTMAEEILHNAQNDPLRDFAVLLPTPAGSLPKRGITTMIPTGECWTCISETSGRPCRIANIFGARATSII